MQKKCLCPPARGVQEAAHRCCGAAAELRFCPSAGIPCEPPPDIPNGQHSGRLQSEFHYGTAVTYSCKHGLPLHGEPSIHCTTRDGHSGVWSEPLPACGAPLRVGKLQPAGITAPASPRAGTGRAGECLINIFSRKMIFSVLKLQPLVASHCPALPEEASCPVPQIQHGRIVAARAAYAHRDTVTFQCDPGYAIRGHREIQCQPNNTWEPPVPVCEQGKSWLFSVLAGGCRAPARLGFAELKEPYRNQTVFPEGSRVEFECQPGYSQRLGVSPAITCLSNQTWSAALEFCKSTSCKCWKPEVGGLAALSVSPALRVSLPALWCHPCWADGCCHSLPEKQCPNPGNPENGRAVVLTDLLLGSKINYTCDKGNPVPKSELLAATCKGCKEISNIKNLTVKIMNPSVWSRYKLVGGSQRICEVSGTHVSWSGDPPVCRLLTPPCPLVLPTGVTCAAPPAIPNGTHSGGSRDTFSLGDVVTYTCASGLAPAGDTSLSCTSGDGERGTWSGTVPRCQGTARGVPTASSGWPWHKGQPGAGPAPMGTQLTQLISCIHSKRWGFWCLSCPAPFLTCLSLFPAEVRCPAPPSIANGQHGASPGARHSPGSEVRYTCAEGYSLLGNASIRCTARGTWSRPQPRCRGAFLGSFLLLGS
ncbi:hypothetical protein EK904_014672 [Melospiza melodia maxima]|nr:hypothetical protein EK904_014672 [Melospiza melodia maxima]